MKLDPSPRDELLCNGAEDSDEDGVQLGLITFLAQHIFVHSLFEFEMSTWK